MRKVHRETTASLRATTDFGGIAEHLGQRDLHVDDFRAAARFASLQLAAPRVQVRDHGPHVILRNYHFNAHDGIEQLWISFLAGVLESHRPRDFTRHFRAVHVVVAAVFEHHGAIDHFIAREYARFHRFAYAVLDRLDEFLGNRSANDFVN